MHCHGEEGVMTAWRLMTCELCVWGFLSIVIRIMNLVVSLRVSGRNQNPVWIDQMGVSLRSQRKGKSMIYKWKLEAIIEPKVIQPNVHLSRLVPQMAIQLTGFLLNAHNVGNP